MVKVSRIMNTYAPTIKKEAKVSDAAKIIAETFYGCVVVVDKEKPLGMITETDIIKNLIFKKINPKEKVTSIMSSPVISIDSKAPLEMASKIIDTKHFRRYPVVNNEKLVGVVTENDIVHAMNENIKFHRNLQNVILILFVIFEFFIFVLYQHLINFLPFLR